MITEKICVLLYFQPFLCAKHFFFKQRLFLFKGVLKNIQGLLWKIQGLFKDIPQFFNFQGLFKPRANHVNTLDSRILEPSQTRTSR